MQSKRKKSQKMMRMIVSSQILIFKRSPRKISIRATKILLNALKVLLRGTGLKM